MFTWDSAKVRIKINNIKQVMVSNKEEIESNASIPRGSKLRTPISTNSDNTYSNDDGDKYKYEIVKIYTLEWRSRNN